MSSLLDAILGGGLLDELIGDRGSRGHNARIHPDDRMSDTQVEDMSKKIDAFLNELNPLLDKHFPFPDEEVKGPLLETHSARISALLNALGHFIGTEAAVVSPALLKVSEGVAQSVPQIARATFYGSMAVLLRSSIEGLSQKEVRQRIADYKAQEKAKEADGKRAGDIHDPQGSAAGPGTKAPDPLDCREEQAARTGAGESPRHEY